jgi:FMN phosphatase YigB (HAD superfamily)
MLLEDRQAGTCPRWHPIDFISGWSVTNSSSSQQRLEEKLAGAGILHTWHVIVNSAEEGVAKPDARIYAIAAQRIGVEPSECVHIDDKWENVVGAWAAGFSAIHYTGSCAELARSSVRWALRQELRGDAQTAGMFACVSSAQ